MLLLDLISLIIPLSNTISSKFTSKVFRAYFIKAFLKLKDAALMADPESGTDKLLAVLPSFGDISVSNFIIST